MRTIIKTIIFMTLVLLLASPVLADVSDFNSSVILSIGCEGNVGNRVDATNVSSSGITFSTNVMTNAGNKSCQMTNGYIYTNLNLNSSDGHFSFSVRSNGTNITGATGTPIGNRKVNGAWTGFQLRSDIPNNGEISVEIYPNAAGSADRATIADGDTADNVWYCIVGTFNITSNVTKIYLDGVLKDTATPSASGGYDASSEGIAFGKDMNQSDGDPWLGHLDEIVIWDDVVLAGEDINQTCETIYPFTPAAAPFTNTSWNVTSSNVVPGESTIIWDVGGVINITSDLLSFTVTTSYASNGTCRLDVEQNYSQMVAANANYKFATTNTTSHSYVVFDNITVGDHCLHCSFDPSAASGFNQTASNESHSGCLNTTRLKSGEGLVVDSGEVAVNNSVVYIINLTSDQVLFNTTTNSTGGFNVGIMADGIYLACAMDENNYTKGADAKIINVTN